MNWATFEKMASLKLHNSGSRQTSGRRRKSFQSLEIKERFHFTSIEF